MQTKKKQTKKDPTDKILQSERNLTHRQKTLSRAKGTAKSMLKGALVGASTASAMGVTGGKGKTVRSGKQYQSGVVGGAIMGAISGYAKDRKKRKKNK